MGTVVAVTSMRCQYCQKPISLLRRLSDAEFCSAQHRQAYEDEQAALAVSRLREAAASTGRKHARKPQISEVAVPAELVTAGAGRPDTMPGAEPDGFPLAGLRDLGPKEAGWAGPPAGSPPGICDPIQPPLGVMLAASLVGAAAVPSRQRLPWATEVVMFLAPRPGRTAALARYDVYPGRPQPVLPRLGLAPEGIALPTAPAPAPEAAPPPVAGLTAAEGLRPAAGVRLFAVPEAEWLEQGLIAYPGPAEVPPPAGVRTGAAAPCALEGPERVAASSLFARAVEAVAAAAAPVGPPWKEAGLAAGPLLDEENIRLAQRASVLAEAALLRCIEALPAPVCAPLPPPGARTAPVAQRLIPVDPAPGAGVVALPLAGLAASGATPQLKTRAAGAAWPEPLVAAVAGGIAPGPAVLTPLAAVGAPVVPEWGGRPAVPAPESFGEALPIVLPAAGAEPAARAVIAAGEAEIELAPLTPARPEGFGSPSPAVRAGTVPLSVEPLRSREPAPAEAARPLAAALLPALPVAPGTAAAPPVLAPLATPPGLSPVRGEWSEPGALGPLAASASGPVPPASPIAALLPVSASSATLLALPGPAAAKAGLLPAATELGTAPLEIVTVPPARAAAPAPAGRGRGEQLFSLATRMPMRRDCWRLAAAAPWQVPAARPAVASPRIALASLQDPRAFHIASSKSVRDLLQTQSFRSAKRFWRFAPADIKWLALALPLLLAVWLWSSSSTVSQAAPPMPAPIGEEPAAVTKKPSVLEKSLAGFEGRIAQRSRVHFEEDFRSGLGLWLGDGNWARSWSYDKAGLIRPGRLAIYEPSIPMTDYAADLHAAFEHRALSWVFRARDLRNYYAMRLTAVGSGPGQRLSLERWTVKEGKVTRRQTLPVALTLGTTTTLRLHQEIRGNTYTTLLQDQVIDVFTDATHASGGFGLFSNDGDQPRIYRLSLAYQDDFLGKLCSFLAPHPITTPGTSRP